MHACISEWLDLFQSCNFEGFVFMIDIFYSFHPQEALEENKKAKKTKS